MREIGHVWPAIIHGLVCLLFNVEMQHTLFFPVAMDPATVASFLANSVPLQLFAKRTEQLNPIAHTHTHTHSWLHYNQCVNRRFFFMLDVRPLFVRALDHSYILFLVMYP
jgi:hypothetical protein